MAADTRAPDRHGTLLDVLTQMRDRRGGPNRRMRALALVLVLLLAGPLTALLVQGAVRALSAVY